MATSTESKPVGIKVPGSTYNPAVLEQIMSEHVFPLLNADVSEATTHWLGAWSGEVATYIWFLTDETDDYVKKVMEEFLPDLSWSRAGSVG